MFRFLGQAQPRISPAPAEAKVANYYGNSAQQSLVMLPLPENSQYPGKGCARDAPVMRQGGQGGQAMAQ